MCSRSVTIFAERSFSCRKVLHSTRSSRQHGHRQSFTYTSVFASRTITEKNGFCKESVEPGNNSKKNKLELKTNLCDELSSTKLRDSYSILKYELDNREQQTSSDKQKSGVIEGCQLSKTGSPFFVRETAVNWELESTVRKIQQFFQTTLRNKEEFEVFTYNNAMYGVLIQFGAISGAVPTTISCCCM